MFNPLKIKFSLINFLFHINLSYEKKLLRLLFEN